MPSLEFDDIDLRIIENAIDMYNEEYSYQWSCEGRERMKALRDRISQHIIYPASDETKKFFLHFIKPRERW